MLWVLRDRRQAGRLELDGNLVRAQRPVRGAGRAEQGVGGCRVVAGIGLPRCFCPICEAGLREISNSQKAAPLIFANATYRIGIGHGPG
jgi:hypothetical protein